MRRGPFLDRLAGLTDGLRGLPDVQTPRATARLARIERWASGQNSLLSSYYAPLVCELQGLRQRLEIAHGLQTRRVDEVRSGMKELLAAGPESGPLLGESALPAQLVATRRRREFERAVQSLRSRIAKAEDELAATEQFAAACVTSLEAMQQQWNAGIEKIAATAGRRRAKYLAGVTWSHPDRAAVVAAFAQPEAADDYEQLHLVTTEETA